MVELPYKREQPVAGGSASPACSAMGAVPHPLTVAAFQDALAHLQPHRVDLKMPKFHIDKTISLEKDLREKNASGLFRRGRFDRY